MGIINQIKTQQEGASGGIVSRIKAQQEPVAEENQSSGIFGRALNRTEQKAKDKYGEDSLAYKYGTAPARGLLRTGAFVGDILSYGTQKFGDTLGKASAASGNADLYSQALEQHTQTQNNILKAINEKKKTGQDVSSLQKLLNQHIANTPQLKDFTGDVIDKTGLQIAGEGAQMFADVAGLGVYGKAASGVSFVSRGGNLTKATKIPSAVTLAYPKAQTALSILKSTGQKSATGALVGGGYDIAQNLSEGKTGTDVLTDGYGKFIGAGIPLVGGTVALTKLGLKNATDPTRLMNTVFGLNPTDYQKFKDMTGKDIGQYANETDMYGNIQTIANKLSKRAASSMAKADNGLAMIDGVYQQQEIKDVLAELVAREKNIGVAGKDTKKIGSLVQKFMQDGLDMSEINQVKRMFDRSFTFAYKKNPTTVTPEAVERATRLADALRGWQFGEAARRGFVDLPAINKETQAAKFLLNAIGKKYSGNANQIIGLGDLVLAAGGDINSVGMILGRKIFTSKPSLSAIANLRYGNGAKNILPKGTVKPTLQFPALNVGARATKQPGTARTVSEVFQPGVTKVAPTGSSAGIYDNIKGEPIAQSTRQSLSGILPQQKQVGIETKSYTPTIPQKQIKSNGQSGFAKKETLAGASTVAGLFALGKKSLTPKETTYYGKLPEKKTEEKKEGNTAQKNNNPGNLIYMEQAGATKGEKRPDGTYWAVFKTPEEGHLAAQKDIQIKLRKNPNMTIKQLVNLRSPATENKVSDILYNVMDELWDLKEKFPNLNSSFLVKNLPIERIEDALAKAEGFYSSKNLNK